MENRLKEIYKTNEGYEVEIISKDNNLYNIRIINSEIILYNYTFQSIKDGRVKNPYHPSVNKIGYYGIGKYKSWDNLNKKNTKVYKCWKSMMDRCYSGFYIKENISYTDCTVDPRWHNFQVFAEWFEQSYVEGFALDKDILVKGNKIYSPETCCFVPQEINKILTIRQNHRGDYPLGVVIRKNGKFVTRISKYRQLYHLGVFDTPIDAFKKHKTAKEAYIKEVADKWKGQITEQVYQALINYNIEITD